MDRQTDTHTVCRRRFDLLATATTPPRRINFRREKGREDRNNKGDKRKQKENEIIKTTRKRIRYYTQQHYTVAGI